MDDLMTEHELGELLRREEGQFLEFKSLWDQECDGPRLLKRPKVRDWIAEYAAAFANADGGRMILGVEDDGTPSGHEYPDEAVRDFLAVPARRLRPPVRIRSQRACLGKHEVIVIDVPMHPEAVMVEGNGFPFRVGDQIIKEAQEAINQRKQSYRRVGYEQRVRPEADVADLDLDLARSFFGRTVYTNRSVEEILLLYGLIRPKGGGMGVTNAALMLFAKTPLVRWHPRAGIRLFRVRGTDRQHGARRNVTQLPRLELPLARAIEETHKTVSAHIRRSEKLHSLFFREMPEYPEFAWQEAIVNAFAHRDYGDQTREIEVWLFEDRMEVNSPGSLVPAVTLEQLRSRVPVHATRNPLIVRVLADVGIMREEGEGIPRMFEEMEASFLQPPQFETDESGFQVILHNQPIFEGASAGWRNLVNRLALTTAQKRVLMAHPEGFTNEDYRRLSGSNRDQAYREIQEMVAKGVVLSAEAAGRGAVYRLSPDLHEMRVWLEARLPALREHFRGSARLTNKQYRLLFGVTRYVATRELSALAREGLLQRFGRRRGSHYLAGPSLGAEREE